MLDVRLVDEDGALLTLSFHILNFGLLVDLQPTSETRLLNSCSDVILKALITNWKRPKTGKVGTILRF